MFSIINQQSSFDLLNAINITIERQSDKKTKKSYNEKASQAAGWGLGGRKGSLKPFDYGFESKQFRSVETAAVQFANFCWKLYNNQQKHFAANAASVDWVNDIIINRTANQQALSSLMRRPENGGKKQSNKAFDTKHLPKDVVHCAHNRDRRTTALLHSFQAGRSFSLR